jgi:peptidoglycan/LPS O-acetylase OafA/YrhL
MRALAAIAVVAFHASYYNPWSTHWIVNFVEEHSAGPPITAVLMFFLISGFVLYRPYIAARYDSRPTPDLRGYAIRRVLRIVPAYWFALTVIGIIWGYTYLWHPTGFIRYYMFLQLYGNGHVVGGGDPVAWSLCVEVTFYAAVPLLALAARRLGRSRLGGGSVMRSELILFAAMVVVANIYQFALAVQNPLPHAVLWELLPALPGSLDLFEAGMFLALLSVEYDRRASPRRAVRLVNRHPVVLWLIGLGLLALVTKVPATGANLVFWWMPTHWLKLLGCACILAPLVIGPQEHGALRRVLSLRPMLWLGTISYGIFLWHWPFVAHLDPHLASHGRLLTFAVPCAIAIGCATVSYYGLERPALRWAKRLTAPRGGGLPGAAVTPVAGPPPAPAATPPAPVVAQS